ncbi:MAG: 50S ribosomal protein L31e [Candidatus Nezhaarchaeota archaeon]|nr:50S ribosomal protein L31e [Candidatus Nezhaarchaeota archaeon]MCX8142119.1 50S ribosomal protein L31e [Candidatus Nezhaarchaeota archaeon]MDW8050100.1 50S ribosomal protein L31e [Nitrososphaerota archaeon]
MSEEREVEVEIERLYTIPLKTALKVPRWRRAARATRLIRSFISRHMKSKVVKINPKISEMVWSKGAKKPPRRIKVKAIKYKDGTVNVEPI